MCAKSTSLQYKYDGENRLASFNNGTASYTYVGALRVKKVSGSTTTVYVSSGSKVIAEYVNSALSREYIYGGSALLATYEGGALKYHQQDHLSVRLTTDTAGTVLAQQGHYPFGEQWYAGAGSTKWQFTTYERNSESGLDQAVFRYDSTRIGRFTSPDPLAGSIGDPQSLNRYAYVENDPGNWEDPLGLIPFGACAIDGACVPLWGGGGGGSKYWDILNPNANAAFGTWIPTWVHSVTLAGTQESWGYYTWMYFPDPFSGGGKGGGWKDDPKNLILKVKTDCFDKNQGWRETVYELKTLSGENPQGQYNVTEQVSDTSLAPPWGQSTDPNKNTFDDTIRPSFGSAATTTSVQYFLVSPNTLDNAQWVPMNRTEGVVQFNNITMTGGGFAPQNNVIVVNGRQAPPCK